MRHLAKKVRLDVLAMTSLGGSSHIGSAFSIVDILAVLYGQVMHIDPNRPKMPDRDRFVLSKGHAGAAVYATLAELGFFSVDTLSTHYQNGSILSGHISHKGVPGVEVSTGSLGHGMGIAAGIALAAKLQNKSFRTFVLISDGELDEGSNWEALLFAAHHKLHNLCIILDYNKLQSMDTISNTLALEPLSDKFISFGLRVIEVSGHCHDELLSAFNSVQLSERPTIIICHTVKGKGVSFMENSVLWHYRSPQGDEYDAAYNELMSIDIASH